MFTEYRTTQDWLHGLLTARGLGGEQLALLHGGMDERRREHLKAAFQAPPDRAPVRSCSPRTPRREGIDLQLHCHRLIHYDIPFNPNRLEQRIGRLDRYLQEHTRSRSCTSSARAGSTRQPGSYDGDLEYLSRVAQKVAVERQDLGSVNPVLARACRGAHARPAVPGRPAGREPEAVGGQRCARSGTCASKSAGCALSSTRASTHLHVAPANVRRVVDTALALAGQPPLADESGPGNRGLVAPPELRAGWERTVADLPDPLEGKPRPLTFDPAAAAARPEGSVVLAHLGHPLVAQATRLLRSALWGGRTALHRIAAVTFTPPEGTVTDGVLVAVFARLVIVGADGQRLHEEVMLAAREVPASGRSRRVELEQPRNAGLRAAVEGALEPQAARLAPQAGREERGAPLG